MLLHSIIFTDVGEEQTNDNMSGSAALSAARKRRASSGPLATNSIPAASAYYSKGQAIVPPSFQHENKQQPFPIQNGIPPQPMNIYENIELIKRQLAERTKLIQTQGSSMQPEKLRVLQKQNEIQTQILKQKMAIAKQMEMTEKEQPDMYDRRGPVSIQSLTEPEFLYEKGVPRKNPNYKTVVESQPSSRNASMTSSSKQQLTPFVSMLLDTGVVPPPIVILKSHDAKLEEHNQILHNILHRLDNIHSDKNAESKETTAVSHNVKRDEKHSENAGVVDDAEDAEEGDEELLMDVVINDLTNSREFVEGIVNKIVNETNLSEVIMKIEPIVKENQELRSLLHSQQQMMNEMNTMLLRLLNQDSKQTQEEQSEDSTYQDSGLDGDGLYQPEMTEIVLTHYPEANDSMATTDTTNDAVSSDVNGGDTESGKEACESEAAPETEETAPEDDEHDKLASVDPNDQYLDYSMPHFPDPISLIVTDIQDES